ncbi:MAG: hypothetical protein AAB576_06430 [Elusimicrobiota bacterium]
MPEDSARHKIRLRLPDGAEFEAEGSPEFVSGELKDFVAMQRREKTDPRPAQVRRAPAEQAPQQDPAYASDPRPGALRVPWDTLIETGVAGIRLRAKLGGGKDDKDACLVLLAASQALLKENKPTAGRLARWLRASGYPIGRVDRVIAQAVEQGEVLASGSRRARRYELSGPGKAKAYLLAIRLTELIEGPGQ